MSNRVSLQTSTAEKLIQAVSDLSARRGMAELSSRSLAEHAGVSASAVNYAFGSLDQLIASARSIADEKRAAAWNRRIAALDGLDCGISDLGPILFSTAREVATGSPGEEALFWADTIDSARLGRTTEAANGVTRERLFWCGLLKACRLETVRPEILHAFSLALRFAYRVFHDPERFDPWAVALTNRLADRVTGESCAAPVDNAWRRHAERQANLSESAQISDHETAQRVLKTSIQIVLTDGAERATFREIAHRAGLSVSSVQHFFGSRRAYLVAAFQAIYKATLDRAVPNLPESNTLTAQEMAAILSGGNRGGPAFPPQEYAAMQGLMLSASHDGETRVLAEGLIARTGQTSLALLGALRSPRGEVGRLDAQLLSLILTHFVTLEIAGMPPDDGSDEAGSLAEHLLAALFL